MYVLLVIPVLGAVVTIYFTPSSKTARIVQTKVTMRGGGKNIATTTMTAQWGPSPPGPNGDDETGNAAVDSKYDENDGRGSGGTAERKGESSSVALTSPATGAVPTTHIPPGETCSSIHAAKKGEGEGIKMDSNGLWTPHVDEKHSHAKAVDKRLRIVVNEGEDCGDGVSPKNQVLVFDMSGN